MLKLRNLFLLFGLWLVYGCLFAQDSLPFIMDMVHNNPGEQPYNTKYTDGRFLRAQGFNGIVPHWHINCAVSYDSYKSGLTQKGSKERKWIDEKARIIRIKLDSLKSAGLAVYPFTDFLVFPQSVWDRYEKEIEGRGGVASDSHSGKRARRVNIKSKLTQKLLKVQINEIFDRFSEIDGLVVRFGETYLQDTPYHSGGSPISDADAIEDHILFLQILREEICLKRNKKLFYRTWDFGFCFHNNPDFYLQVTNAIEPHPNLFFSIKYQQGDFHRNSPFNPTIGIGKHQQVIESQSRMEAYGKGAHPYYIGSGVINGWPETKYEIEWNTYRLTDRLADPSRPRGLKDILSSGKLAGVMTWSHGGGWQGPYISHELWTDLNTFVVSQWAMSPHESEESIFYRFTEHLGLDERNADIFRKIALLSIEGVRKGHMNSFVQNDPWWTRDEFFSVAANKKVLSEILERNLQEKVLAEKAEASAIWLQIENLSKQFSCDNVELESVVRVSCTYGRIKYQLIEQMWKLMIAYETGKDSQYDFPAIAADVQRYEKLWEEWKRLSRASSWCATLYTEKAFRNRTEGSIGEFVSQLKEMLKENNK